MGDHAYRYVQQVHVQRSVSSGEAFLGWKQFVYELSAVHVTIMSVPLYRSDTHWSAWVTAKVRPPKSVLVVKIEWTMSCRTSQQLNLCCPQ